MRLELPPDGHGYCDVCGRLRPTETLTVVCSETLAGVAMCAGSPPECQSTFGMAVTKANENYPRRPADWDD